MRLMTSVLLLATVACIVSKDDSPTAPTNASLAGTWTLQTVNGNPLPFTIYQDGTEKDDLVGDVITVTASGTFTELSTVRYTANGQTFVDTYEYSGTYVLTGTSVTYTFSDGGSRAAAISGNTFSLVDANLVYVYKKQ